MMEMLSVRCKNPHPRLVGKPCNGMIKIAAQGQVVIGCPRCYGYINIDFDEAGTEDSSMNSKWRCDII